MGANGTIGRSELIINGNAGFSHICIILLHIRPAATFINQLEMVKQ